MECIENCYIISTYLEGNHFFQDPQKWQSFFNAAKVCICTESGVHSYNCLDWNHHRTFNRNYAYTVPAFWPLKIVWMNIVQFGFIIYWFPSQNPKKFVFPINCRGLPRPPLCDFVLGNIKYLETFHPWTNTTLDADAENAPKQETTTMFKSNN